MSGKKSRQNFVPTVSVLALGVAAGMVASVAPMRVTHAQTAAQTTGSSKTLVASAKASPVPPKKHKLRSRELTPSAGDPYAALPNYASSAVALRHWRQPEIVVHVIPADDDKRTPEQLNAIVKQGLALWQDKIGSKVAFKLTDSADDADMSISFVPAGSLSGNRLGVTDVQFTIPEQDIQTAKIRIVEGLSATQLVQVVAHESGHALGIQGHSDDKHDLMYAYSHLPAAISARDENTMNVGYYDIDTSKKVRAFKRGQKFGSATSF